MVLRLRNHGYMHIINCEGACGTRPLVASVNPFQRVLESEAASREKNCQDLPPRDLAGQAHAPTNQTPPCRNRSLYRNVVGIYRTASNIVGLSVNTTRFQNINGLILLLTHIVNDQNMNLFCCKRARISTDFVSGFS